MKKIVLFLLLIMAVFCSTAAMNASAAAYRNNYLNEVRTTKLHPNTIKVWVQDSQYKGTAYDAFNEWVAASGGCISFREANTPKTANIVVYFVDKLPGPAVGVTTYSRPISIRVATIRYGMKNTKISKREAYPILVHEIGHALGIQGHSSNNNDIMYPNTNIIGIHASDRDVNTIRAMYCRK